MATKKRSADEAGVADDGQPPAKAQALDPETAAAPPVEEPSRHIIYPGRIEGLQGCVTYDDFDSQRVVFAKEPQRSSDGSGELLYVSYQFADGSFPLLIQTPNATYSPTGINVYKDGNASMILSCGRDWEQSTPLVKFHAICEAIQRRCVEVVVEKGWNANGSQEPEAVAKLFNDVMGSGTNPETGQPYPPSMRVAVRVTGEKAVELYKKVDGVAMPCIPADAVKGCSITGIVEFGWIFRKKNKKEWSFSVRTTLTQAYVWPRLSVARAAGGPAKGRVSIVDSC